jgi:hypothetical protein
VGSKTNPGKYDCYSVLEPDEPHFVIAGRDPAGGMVVRLWAFARSELIRQGKKPRSDYALVEEARTVADAMDLFAAEWAERKAKLQ